MLLQEYGLPRFNTNLLAKRSGVSVRAIYRYFPNKQVLVVELARRLMQAWHELLDDGYALGDPNSDWRRLWCGYIDRYFTAARATPGAAAILLAMRADPELRAVDDEANAVYVRDVATALIARKPRLDRHDADALAALLVTTTASIVDAALAESPARARRMLELLKAMHVALLGRYLDGPRPLSPLRGRTSRKLMVPQVGPLPRRHGTRHRRT